MTLGRGTRLGPYEIVDLLGAGGMGEVYRARDTRLDRTVAIKVLPPQLASDAQFRERFEREARAISQLTHPHICTLHDVGEHGRTAFLVMEYLEGETLADRLKKGPLPIEAALQHAIDIARALEAAHRHGIVHRDLKPGNIMLTKSGVKLLDFGLAKVGTAAVASSAFATEMETMAPLTAQGTILGTFQYMAPEQLQGGEADTRADIWAFGCVLYEMIAGRPAFEGKTQVSVMGAILEREPTPINDLQPKTPPALARVIRTCLAKDPDDRFESAHDLRLELQWIPEGASVAGLPSPLVVGRRRRGHLIWAGIAAVAFAMGVATAKWLLKPAATIAPVVTRFEYVLPEGQSFSGDTGVRALALSPDGTKLAYVANQQLYVREMNQLAALPIRGTNDDPHDPVFSPDGAWIAYFVRAGTGTTARTLKKVAITGGAPVTLAQLPAPPFGASWGAGMILFGMDRDDASGVHAVPERGGIPQTLIRVDAANERAAHPQLLDDAKHVLFVVVPRGGAGEPQIVVQPITGGDRKALIAGGIDARVVRTRHLVYLQQGRLLAVPFDPTRLTVSGDPVPLTEGVDWYSGTATGQFAIALNGTLAFRPGTGERLRQLLWVDRYGREQPIAAKARAYAYPRVSPDGTKIATNSIDEEVDIWVYDLGKETLMRMTFGAPHDVSPVWTPDGRHLLFGSGENALAHVPRDIFRKSADGTRTPEALTQNVTGGSPESVSPDGRWVVFRRGVYDLYLLPLEAGAQPRPLFADPRYKEVNGEISPDGRWLAYQSNESGRDEVYVRPFPNVDGGRWQISRDGGGYPLWARSGLELFFMTSTNRLVVVQIKSSPGFDFSSPRPLFDLAPYLLSSVGRPFDISSDGQRFVVVKAAYGSSARPSIVIVSNWVEELKRLVPTN